MGRIVKLPKVDYTGSMTLEKAMAQRRSRRNFSDEAITLEQLGQLCWAAQGKTTPATLGKAGRLKTVPSAGATYPLELFVATSEGLFHYLPDGHSIEELTAKDIRGELAAAAWGQDFIKQAAATYILAAEFARTTGRYRERGIRYVYMEAGHAAQNILLEAEALGLGSVVVGAFDDGAAKKVLGLAEKFEPIYMVVVGHCSK